MNATEKELRATPLRIEVVTKTVGTFMNGSPAESVQAQFAKKRP
jgi:hypothetical protein